MIISLKHFPYFRQPFIFFLGFWIPVLLIGFSHLASAAEEEAKSSEKATPSTLTATGHGEVAEPPDRATLRLGVETQADDAAAAQSAVNAVMQKAITQIQEAGIAEKSIQTEGLNLYPVYAHPEPGREAETPRVVAYRASNTLQIQIDDISRVGKVIDAGMAAGVNRLEGVSFGFQNDLPHRTRALTLAVAEARVKAEEIARALNMRLVRVMEVTEGGSSIIPRHENFAGARTMTAAATPVQPGEVRVQASVTIAYKIAEVRNRDPNKVPAQKTGKVD